MKNKIIKKLCVYLLVGLIGISSVMLSYQKANSCEAVATGAGIAVAVLLLGVGLYGAYYVAAQPEVQDGLKETFTNYKNETVEGAKNAYEFNKKLFNDFCTYAQSNGGGSASVYTASGQSYSIDQMQAEGFPSFEKWDDEMKKQSEKPKPSLWDLINFGVDLLDLIVPFFTDKNYVAPSDNRPQLYFTGDSGYINRETGDVHVYFYGDYNMAYNPDRMTDSKFFDLQTNVSHFSNQEQYKETYRIACLFSYQPNLTTYSNSWDSSTLNNTFEFYRMGGYANINYVNYVSNGSIAINPLFVSGFTQNLNTNGDKPKVVNDSFEDISARYLRLSFNGKDATDHEATELTLSRFDFLSTNVPVFTDSNKYRSYLLGESDGEDAINYVGPGSLTPTPTPGPGKEMTPLQHYVNHFYSGSYSPGIVANINYNIANNWDGSTTNLTYILNGNVTPTPEPTNTPKPTKIAPSGDSNNYTNYNFFVDLSNFLQPIKDAIESILDFLLKILSFFTIDIDAISIELNNTNVLPTGQFTNFVDTFTNLKTTFSDDDQQSLAAVGSTQKGIDYPVLKVKCPKILLSYLPDAEEVAYYDDKDVGYIVLCDTSKYAVQFSAVRTILKALIWFGFIFYLMRELKVVISLNG